MNATETKQEYKLSVSDRCDYCGSQAYVMVRGVSGELIFCAHDYTKILSSETGKAKLEAFAYEIIDERDKLIENRLIGDDT